MKINWSVGYILAAALASSCTINGDDYQIKSLSVNPEMAIPLATGTLSIQDILDQTDSAYVKVYPDGLVYLSYEDTLASQDIRNLVDIPDLGTVNRSLSFPAATYPPSGSDILSTTSTSSVDMGINPEKLTEITFKVGDFNYAMNLSPSNPNVAYAVQIRIPEFKSDATGNAFQQTVSGTNSISLAGYTFKNTTANTFTLELTLVRKQHANTYTVAGGTNVNISINYTGVNFKYIKGFFGDQIATPPSQSVRIGTFGNFLEDGSVSFAAPKIELNVINDYGVPLQVTFTTFEGRKTGASPLPIILNRPNPITIKQPASLGLYDTTIVFVKNVNQLFDYGPSEFYYQVSGHINSGLTSGINFMADTSKMHVRMNVELPLYGKASNIVLTDTSALDLKDLDQSQIESAEIKALITNELPLDANIQINFLDENKVLLESLLSSTQTNIVNGSKVSANGDFESSVISDNTIPLDQAKINTIFIAKYIVISATLNTSKISGNLVNVKFKSALAINVQLGLKVKLKLKTDL